MDRAARNEIDQSSKKQRVNRTPQPAPSVGAKAKEVPPASSGQTTSSGHKKYIPNWQVYENNSVFEDKTSDIAVELMRGAVLPADRVYVNSLQPKVVSSHLMQGIAQMPALVDKLTQECLNSQTNLKSIEAALKVEKVERKRWEHLYKQVYSKLHIDGVDADQITIQSEKEESPIKIELERKLDEKQKIIGALEERLEAMKNLKDKGDLSFNQRIRELNEQVHALQKQTEKDKSTIKMELETKLDEKQKNIGALEERLKEMKKLKDKDDLALNQRIRELNEQVLELETLNQMLIVKERQSNDMLQDARKALIEGMSDLKSKGNDHFGIKMMGELDVKIFTRTGNKLKNNPRQYEIEAVEWCTLWQKRLNNPEWYPFQVTVDDAGNSQELLKKNDSSLQNLKEIWGDEVYNEVTTTLKELIEYNPSGRFPVPELWNFKENRKATPEEVIRYNFTQMKPPLKRRRS